LTRQNARSAWTTQEERLVLNAVLYPAGAAIPAS
jgi:hypothetical protein